MEDNQHTSAASISQSIDDTDRQDEDFSPIKRELSRKEHRRILTASISILAFLAVLYTIYFASGILLPIMLSILFALVLQPSVRALMWLGLSSMIAAALVVFTIITLVISGLYFLSGPANEWAQKAPDLLTNIESKIEPIKKPLSQIQDAKEQVEKLASSGQGDNGGQMVAADASQDSMSLPQTLQASSSFIINSVFVMMLVYLLLASDGNYLRKLVTILPTFKDKRRAVELTSAVELCVSRYLATITIVNLALGVVTALTMWFLDMPNPILWGILAGTLNFVPYIGPSIAWLIILVVSFLSFDSMAQIITPPLAFLCITMLEGQLVTPIFAGKQLELSPVAIFVFLAFMGWLWGVVGMLIAIPLLASIKIVCTEVELLNPVAVMLGR